MKAVADTLGVARSNLVVRAARGRRSRLPYRKAGDPELLEQVDQAVDALGAGGHQPQSLNQALDVRVVQGNALHQLAVHLELDGCLTCHGLSRRSLTPAPAVAPPSWAT